MPRELFCFSHHSGVFSLCMVGFYTVMGRFLYFSWIAGAPLLHQPGIYLSRLISRAFFFSPDTFSPAMARRYTIRPPHSTHSNGSRLRNCFTICAWHTFATASGLSIPGARYTCDSFSPHTRLARNPKYLTILKNVSGMCCFSLATSSRCVSVSVAVSPVLWSG